MTPDGAPKSNTRARTFDVVHVRRRRFEDGKLRWRDESSQHAREIVHMTKREVLGASASDVQHLASGRALVEAGDHDRQLRAPGLHTPHEMPHRGPAPA